jgi:glutathione S-transferase
MLMYLLGSDYYTLPMLQTPSGEVIGDSFDIATYLEDNFPNSGGSLFPKDSTRTGLDFESPQKDTTILIPITTNEGKKNQDYARFNWHVDATFTHHVILVAYYMPFNPTTKEATQQIFLNRANMDSWEQFKVEGDVREGLKLSFKQSLASLAQYYTINEGPYLEGKEANYADIIVGGWLNMFAECMPAEEWEDFRTWHGGVFARLHDALHKNYYVCK